MQRCETQHTGSICDISVEPPCAIHIQSSHRGEHKFRGEVNESSQAGGQVNALRAAPQTVVEDLDEVFQAILVHGVYERQVSHDKVQDGAPLWKRLVLLSGQVDLCLCVLRLLDPFGYDLCSHSLSSCVVWIALPD